MDDEGLAAMAREDGEAFAELYRRHVGLVTGSAARRVNDPEERADVVATVWVRVLTNIGRYDPDRGRFLPWLLGVTARVASESRRSAGRRARAHLRLAGQRDLTPDERTSLEDAIAAQQLGSAVRQAMGRLTALERQALDLLAADVTYEEAALLLRVTPAALRMRVHRARRRLNDLLEQCNATVYRAEPEGEPR